jgi:membrane-associated protein
LNYLIDLILHLDTHLNVIISQHSILAYILLFALIFCETGFVVTPFLPGDSLIFATAALAAGGSPISIPFAIMIFIAAAVCGDTVNYQVGHFLRNRVERRQHIPFVKLEHIDRTHAFFQRHGGKTIVIARFIPIIRTFAPFVAGVGTMPYRRFIGYNIIGGISWVGALFTIGYFFGNLPIIKSHFSLILVAIILISVLPAVFALFKNRAVKKNTHDISLD